MKRLLCMGLVSFLVGCTARTPLPTASPSPLITVAPSPTASERISQPGEYEGYSEPLYSEWIKTSQYVTVSDGTRLAVGIYRPAQDGEPVSTPLPVVWTHTRYHRERSSPYWLQTVLKHGYVIGVVGVRGSGASFGTQQEPWSREEAQDAYDITEWFAAQPWCDGNIGMYGRSYLGTTQYMAAGTKPPHLKAIFPEMAHFDLYSLVYSGGVFRNDLAAQWNETVKSLDNWGMPVDEDHGSTMLATALREHEANRDVLELSASLPYRDSLDVKSNERLHLVSSPSTYLDGVRDSGVAIYHWVGWYDAFPRDALLYFSNLTNPQRIVIGPWSHSGSLGLSATAEHLRWYDYWLKGNDNGIMEEAPIYYYTMGASSRRGWHSAWQWPLPNEQPVSYYLSGEPSGSVESANDGSLSLHPPTNASGKDDYLVDYETTTGTHSRWDDTSGRGPMYYLDMTDNDERGLTYTTPRLDSEVEVTGHPVVHLWVTSTAQDGDFFVYLEDYLDDVNATGVSLYVTEGTLRASHRAASAAPYDNLGLPYHRSYAEDIADLPDEPVELIFDLLPTSYVFDVGHRIRVTITCADKDNYLTPELDPPPTISLYRDADHASHIVLPIIPNP